MFIARSKIKNINKDQKIILRRLKDLVQDIQQDDIVYLFFNEGLLVHEKTNKSTESFLTPYHADKDVKRRAKEIFKKCKLISTPNAATAVKFEAQQLSHKLIKTYAGEFTTLLSRNYSRFHISSHTVADIWKISIIKAKELIKILEQEGILRKQQSAWAIPKDIWEQLRIAYGDTVKTKVENDIMQHNEIEGDITEVEPSDELSKEQARKKREIEIHDVGLQIKIVNGELTIDEAYELFLKKKEKKNVKSKKNKK